MQGEKIIGTIQRCSKMRYSFIRKVVCCMLLIALCFSVSACGEGSSHSINQMVDKNGYNSVEMFVDAYVTRMSTIVGKEHIRRMYPEVFWTENMLEMSLDETYSSYKENIGAEIAAMKARFGEDFATSYKILAVKDTTGDDQFDVSDEERQEIRDLLGVEVEKLRNYEVTVSITFKGSKGEATKTEYVIRCRKIGSKWYAF